MQVLSHPKELTKKSVEKWLKDFKNKLKRTTSRDDLDRLILSVERRDDIGADWEKFIFQNGQGKVSKEWFNSGKWALTSFQKTILAENPRFEGKTIQRSELKEEIGEWILDQCLHQRILSSGGEAIVLAETFGELEVAVRVQAFDPALFAKKEDLAFEIHLSKDYGIPGEDDNSTPVIPVHANVIKHFCNIEIFSSKVKSKEDCLGWITIMEKCDSDLRERLKNEDLNLEERKKIAIGIKEGFEYLQSIGILQQDKKPENVLLKNGEAKWIDFGIIEELSGQKSYREMGYARRGKRYRDFKYLFAGSPAFSSSDQLCGIAGGEGSPMHILILCDWKTAWSLLYKPIEKYERENIEGELMVRTSV